MSESSWPNESWRTRRKYVRIRKDTFPWSDSNRSLYRLKCILQLAFVLVFGIQRVAWPGVEPSFTDITKISGITRLVDDHYASYPKWWLSGLHLVDLDGDGDLDLFLSAHGKGVSSASWGIAVTTDFDNDCVADVLVNGKHFLKILRGTGGGSFECVNSLWGIADISAASIDDGLCFGDIDADGDLDIIGYTSISGQRRFAVYRNDLPARNWLRIRLIGLPGNRGAAGAKIRIYTHDESRLLWYEQVTIYDSQAAASYYSLPITERHFGLDKWKIVNISIEFYPSQRLIWRRGVPANSVVVIAEQLTSRQTPSP